jgi:multisubunit Na+/H+ antiporter MnhB subunit
MRGKRNEIGDLYRQYKRDIDRRFEGETVTEYITLGALYGTAWLLVGFVLRFMFPCQLSGYSPARIALLAAVCGGLSVATMYLSRLAYRGRWRRVREVLSALVFVGVVLATAGIKGVNGAAMFYGYLLALPASAMLGEHPFIPVPKRQAAWPGVKAVIAIGVAIYLIWNFNKSPGGGCS